MIFFIAIISLIVSTDTAFCRDKYQSFHMKPEDITAVLNSVLEHSAPQLADTMPDICFGCADVKYDHGTFKIVECGDGIYMSLRATDVIMNKKKYNLVAPFWGLLWHTLHQLNLPTWHVGGITDKNALAISESKKLNVNYAPSLKVLADDEYFQAAISKSSQLPVSINQSAGIIVYVAPMNREKQRDGKEYKEFRTKYPQFLYVNSTARAYLKQKDMTYNLFTRAGLSRFIPTFGVLPTMYNPATAFTIRSLIPNADLMVIKPTFSSLSYGVNIINQARLEPFLKLILQDSAKIPRLAHRSLSYWKYSKQAHFVASEYVPSQIIYKDGNPYDPTMRVMYIMYHNQGVIHVNVLGGFWKIPVKPLNESLANPTETHVTIAHAGDYFSGILLEQAESLRMKQLMAPVLAKAYEQMLIER